MTSPAGERFPEPEPGLDEVVRAQLDAEASRVDAAGMWDRVLARLDADAAPVAPAVPTRRRFAVFAAVAGLAAAVLVAVFVFDSPREVAATPAQVVEAAKTAHARGGDRCYTQTVTFPQGPNRPEFLTDPKPVTLCTRGNRFVVEPAPGGKGAWGRDETGRVWLAPTRDAAARFEASELPPELRDAVRIRGLEFDTLLDDVLKDFDLAWADAPTPGTTTYSVKATRKTAAELWQLASAELVIEKDTNLVRSLLLRRKAGPEGEVTITFEYRGAAEKAPGFYTAEGHLDAGKPVFGAGEKVRRGLMMLRHFKDIVVNGP